MSITHEEKPAKGKHTYKATFRGKEFTRTTARTYSHVIIVVDERGPGALTWVGRPDLLEAQLKRARQSLNGYSEVHAIELKQPKQPVNTSKCDNCGHECSDSKLKAVKHLAQRVAPGGIMPSGECPKCGCLSYPIVQAQTGLLPYTVIAFDSNRMIVQFNVDATNGLHAFAVAAALDECEDDTEFVVAIKGHFKEGEHMDFPGEGLVDAETVLDQADVFCA